MNVAIVALGPTSHGYVEDVQIHGSRSLYDETWVVNYYGDILQSDRIFHMDDVRVQEKRAEGGNEKIKNMLAWMRRHPGPIYTSRAHPDYPGLIDYPLKEVITNLGSDYFNNTAAYAVAFGILFKVRKMTLYGMDFTWPNVHEAEQGRACCEYWVRAAQERGIEVAVAKDSTLMDGFRCKPYGYDTIDVRSEMVDGKIEVSFTPKDEHLPTAEELEARYDHSVRKQL